MANASALPAIEIWWPRLQIPARQWVIAHLEEPLAPHVVAEIVTICELDAATIDDEVVLGLGERQYIITQTELVD